MTYAIAAIVAVALVVVVGVVKMTLGGGKAEDLILIMLEENGPSYGLDLVLKSKGALKRGTVYVYLRGLEEKGLIHSWWEEGDETRGGRRRRMYALIKGKPPRTR